MNGEPRTRREALLAGAGMLVITAVGASDAGAVTAVGDIGVVSHALGVENAVVDAYERILRAGVLDRRATGAARLLADQEREHVAALARALRRLGGAPSDQRDPGVLHGLPVRPRTSAQAWRLAAGVERAALSTYYRAVAQLADDALLQLATEIMANEGQHLALARGRLGHELAPDAFPTGAPPSS